MTVACTNRLVDTGDRHLCDLVGSDHLELESETCRDRCGGAQLATKVNHGPIIIEVVDCF